MAANDGPTACGATGATHPGSATGAGAVAISAYPICAANRAGAAIPRRRRWHPGWHRLGCQ